jgi:hypothetical protein
LVATRAALAAGFDRWEGPLIAGLTRMHDRGELKPDASVEVLADITMAAIQGGLLLTQVRREPEQLRRADRRRRGRLKKTSGWSPD